MNRILLPGVLAAGFLLLSGGAVEVAAQAPPGGLRTMSHFWHVFIAYALAWLILLAWVFSIVRRIARVERRLDR